MAVRGSATRRVPGNAMAGVLRDLNRQARVMKRRRDPDAPTEPMEPPRPAEPRRAPQLWSGPTATVATTDLFGQVRWDFPLPFEVAPVVSALAVADFGGPGDAVTAAILSVDEESVTVQVSIIGPGYVRSAREGVGVHLTAVRSTPVELG
ncbi:hypothetical protein ACFY0G_32275 [Streptomyces sp. NPDC001552]|uniref:hypothetical protein n=1 Tax=Streptomyces sp. NPDC001552 TaxID=3364587 RepID=UPI00367E1E22